MSAQPSQAHLHVPLKVVHAISSSEIIILCIKVSENIDLEENSDLGIESSTVRLSVRHPQRVIMVDVFPLLHMFVGGFLCSGAHSNCNTLHVSVEVRGHLPQVRSLLLLCGCWEWNLGLQAWEQALLPLNHLT